VVSLTLFSELPAANKPLQWAALSRAALMTENHPSDTIAALERKILKALCTGVTDPGDWAEFASQLSAYSWQDPDHKVVYDALRAIRSRDPKTRRDQLPAQATRMGFPDLDWNLYFEGEELSTTEIEELIRKLKTATPNRS
jgi:hypothetical protein